MHVDHCARSHGLGRPYRYTSVRVQVAAAARAAGRPSLRPFNAGPPAAAGPRRRRCRTAQALAGSRVVHVTPGTSSGLAVVGGVPDAVHVPVRERGGEQAQQLGGQLHRGGGALARPQPHQHRQAHRRGAQRQPDHDPGDHPPVPPGDLLPALGGAVVCPERVMDLAAPALEQGVVDHHR